MFKKAKKKLTDISKEYKSLGVLSSVEMSQYIQRSDWFEKINDYTSEVSKAMDSNYFANRSTEVLEKWAPNYHRIKDGGHDLFSSIERAQEVGNQNGWNHLETFTEWSKSYFSDLSSPAGMPVFGKISDQIYEFLKSIGLNEEKARDMVTVNGQEAIESVLSGSIVIVAIVFSWKKEDQEIFSKTIGSLIMTSTVMMNPISLSISLVAFAIGYQRLVNKEAMARGSIITGSGLLTSAFIPGSALLGIIPAIVVSTYVNKKMGKDFKPVEYTNEFAKLIISKEFRVSCSKLFKEHLHNNKAKAA